MRTQRISHALTNQGLFTRTIGKPKGYFCAPCKSWDDIGHIMSDSYDYDLLRQ